MSPTSQWRAADDSDTTSLTLLKVVEGVSVKLTVRWTSWILPVAKSSRMTAVTLRRGGWGCQVGELDETLSRNRVSIS